MSELPWGGFHNASRAQQLLGWRLRRFDNGAEQYRLLLVGWLVAGAYQAVYSGQVTGADVCEEHIS